MYGKSTRQYYVIPQGGNSLQLVTSPEFHEREKGYLGEWQPEKPSSTPLLPENAPVGNVQVETMGKYLIPWVPMQNESLGMANKAAPPLDSHKSNDVAPHPSLVPGKGEENPPMEHQSDEFRPAASVPDESEAHPSDYQSRSQPMDGDPAEEGDLHQVDLEEPTPDGYGETQGQATTGPTIEAKPPQAVTSPPPAEAPRHST